MRPLVRALPVAALAAAACLALTGCVAVTAKDNRFGSGYEAVALRDRIYLINVETGKAQIIDVSEATPFRPADCPDGSAVSH